MEFSTSKKSRFWKFFLLVCGVLGLVVVVSLISFYFFMRASLPILSGTITTLELQAPVTIERDAQGIPTVTGSSRADIAFAMGFLHAQDRFFQIDWFRRHGAGELSELFGEESLAFDQERRFHRFRTQAQMIYEKLNHEEKALLQSYASGVNRGLSALNARPFEYGLLRASPSPWKPEDSLLVLLDFACGLENENGWRDTCRGQMKKLLPPNVYDFFVHNGSAWDAALDKSSLPILAVPSAEDFAYLKNQTLSSQGSVLEIKPQELAASNNWAVSGQKTPDGKALLACDLHLPFVVPNFCYRAALNYVASNGEKVHVSGMTYPGLPFILIGSNEHIAWGLTNSMVDTTDIIILQENPQNPSLYLTPQGWMPFEKHTEIINVKGKEPVSYQISSTIWGPVFEDKFFSSSVALSWAAHSPEYLNLRFLDLETCKDVAQALKVSKQIKYPLWNFIVADSKGHIGWTLIGSIPKRNGFSGLEPVSFADGSRSIDGCIDTKDYPCIIDPPDGCLWTANNRCIGNTQFGFYSQTGFVSGIRAKQIRDKLLSQEKFTERDFLALQLDNEATFFVRWQKLLLEILQNADCTEPRKELLEAVQAWNKKCDADSVGYYWIYSFRDAVMKRILRRVLGPCIAQKNFRYGQQECEEPTWLLVREKPEYLVDPQFGSWDKELLNIVDELLASHGNKVFSETWGEHNKLLMRHRLCNNRLSRVLFGFLLNMPPKGLSGDFCVPKVLNSCAGAAQRMVVSPGRESFGIFHMPGGQSGHPLSPYYRAGHEDWVQGKPSPFLPGPPVHTLHLTCQTQKSAD